MIIRYMEKYWYIAILAALFMVGEVSVDLYQPRMMEVIVDNGILGLNNGGVPDLSIVTSVGIKMILVVILGGLCGVLCGVFSNLCAQNFGNDIRKDCFRRIMHFSFSQTDKFSVGSLITRITSDVTQVQNMIQQLMRGFVRCMMFFIAGSIALVSLDADFRIVIAVSLPLILVEIGIVLWKANPLFDLLQRRLDRMNNVVQENIAGARVVKSFVQEEREEERFEKSNQDLMDTQRRVLVLIAMMRPVMNIILNIATVAIIQIGAFGVQAGRTAPGTVMAAVTYLTQILNGMMMLAMLFQNLTRGITSSKRLKEVLTSESEIRDGAGIPARAGTLEKKESGSDKEPAKKITAGSLRNENRGRVTFRNVSFSYPGHRTQVLHDICLDIAPGETLALIGETGCGKSSIVNLIPRFYDAAEGTVEVGGHDVREYKLEDLRSRIAIVLQKSELFSATIRENISIGRPDASEEEIREAARNAQAEEFILQQREGYDTFVAEAGMSLSGGQRQRVAISRALLKNADVLILDDATSALDFGTEAALQKKLREKYRDVTKIIIAQRIVSVQNADRIAVIDDGRILDCGTHDELMSRCPAYMAIYESQLGEGGAA